MLNNGQILSTGGSNFFYGAGNTGYVFTNNGTINASAGALTIGDGSNDSLTNPRRRRRGHVRGDGELGVSSGSINNSGLLEASGATSVLNVATGGTTWANTGSITAAAGATVNLGGAFATSNLTSGTIDGSAGTINIVGNLNNTTATLATPDGGGFFTLAGGTITGGTVIGGDVLFSNAGGVLSGVAVTGNNALPANTTFTANTNTTFSGGTTTFSSNSVHLNGTGLALTIPTGETWTETSRSRHRALR